MTHLLRLDADVRVLDISENHAAFDTEDMEQVSQVSQRAESHFPAMRAVATLEKKATTKETAALARDMVHTSASSADAVATEQVARVRSRDKGQLAWGMQDRSWRVDCADSSRSRRVDWAQGATDADWDISISQCLTLVQRRPAASALIVVGMWALISALVAIVVLFLSPEGLVSAAFVWLKALPRCFDYISDRAARQIWIETCNYFGFDDAVVLHHSLTGQHMPPAVLGSLAPMVSEAQAAPWSLTRITCCSALSGSIGALLMALYKVHDAA
mmetsp:Transcript_74854/g.208125  ORF Transcript_74854/g.208125 Transcript_74854/m.208125 type:complete len:273 (-) Transcript_74854:77-895(-)